MTRALAILLFLLLCGNAAAFSVVASCDFQNNYAYAYSSLTFTFADCNYSYNNSTGVLSVTSSGYGSIFNMSNTLSCTRTFDIGAGLNPLSVTSRSFSLSVLGSGAIRGGDEDGQPCSCSINASGQYSGRGVQGLVSCTNIGGYSCGGVWSVNHSCEVSFNAPSLDCDGKDSGSSLCEQLLYRTNPDYCSSTQSGADALLETQRQRCVTEYPGAVFSGTVAFMSGGEYCVSGECNVCRSDKFRDEWLNSMASECCIQGNEPSSDVFSKCSNVQQSGPGVSRDPVFLPGLDASEICSGSIAGSGNNYCQTDVNCDNASDPEDCACEHFGQCGGSSDSSEPSSDSSGDGGSSGSGSLTDCNDNANHDHPDCVCQRDPQSCASDGSSGSGGGSPSSDSSQPPSSASVSPSSGSSGYFCDIYPSDPICADAGYDGFCDQFPSNSYCIHSVECSKNPSLPECVNPQPPPYVPPDFEPGKPSGGGSYGDSSDSQGNDSASAVSCKNLNNCDWSTLKTQLVQLHVDSLVLDSLASLIDWLKYKSREDSLIASMRWGSDSLSRQRMIELSETLNGRIFLSQMIASEQLNSLNRMDSMNGLYYSASLSASSANKLAIDTLRLRLTNELGDGFGDVVGAIERLTGTVAGNSGADVSGVVRGINNTNELLGGIGDGIGSLEGAVGSGFGRLDSILSSGNSDILSALEGLGGTCEGDSCGNYDGIGDGAFSGLDTSGISGGRWDELLTPSGSSGLRDSANAFAGKIRSVTATPFVSGMSCPASELSIDACGYFGSECRVSLCDDAFHVKGRHFFEWLGIVFEFAAWVLFLVRIV